MQGGGGIAVLAEEVTGRPDEAYLKVSDELARAFRAYRQVVELALSGAIVESRSRHSLARINALFGCVTNPELRRIRVNACVYASRSSCTLPALLRARLLKLALGGVPVAMLALQPRRLGGWQAAAARHLWPDLLLVGTRLERDRCRAMGARAECVTGGVDLARFRPPEPGEKALLRDKWKLPIRGRVALHVGHLTSGRNLEALIPLLDAGVTVVVAASSVRVPESAGIRERLQRAGVVLIEGFLGDIDELYRLADCYVFTPTSTDFAVATPLSVIEAMASDLPVVSTRFGALPERFPNHPGLRFVDSLDELPEVVGSQIREGPSTRHLVEPYSWSAQAERVLTLIEPRPTVTGSLVPGSPRAFTAAARRAWWRLRDAVREPGTPERERRPPAVELVEGAPPLPAAGADAASDIVGVAPPSPSAPALLEAAGLLGLPTVEGSPEALAARAIRERWPLIAVGVDQHPIADAALPPLGTFVREGGTVLVTPSGPASNRVLARLLQGLGAEAPACRDLAQRPGSLELRGIRVEDEGSRCWLDAGKAGTTIGWKSAGNERLPSVVRYELGSGAILVAAPDGGHVLPALMLLRELYGRRAWHACAMLANFTIDDPALTTDRLGLDYHGLVRLADEARFHVTIATIPRELGLAEPAVVDLLRRRRDVVSACYHGNDHSGYEFSTRPLAAQERALRQAADRGRAFATRTGLALDRVMVFPHGIGPAALLPRLHDLGFLASCNFDDRDPLGAAPPADRRLRLRPADTGWGGFPLRWRRGLDDGGFVLDLLAGRPALTFGHRGALGPDLARFRERADGVNALGGGAVRWCGLEEIALHAYLQRHDPARGWDVLMTSNEICLHNPDPLPRTYRVGRPDAPEGTTLSVGGDAAGAREPLEVEVPGGATRRVRLSASGANAIPDPGGLCSVFHDRG